MAAAAAGSNSPSPTPTGAARRAPATRKSTRTPEHKMPVTSTGNVTMRARGDNTAVTGPGVGQGSTATPGNPMRRGTGAHDVHPCPPGMPSC